MIQRILNHARDRLAFAGDVPKAQRVEACRRFLRLEWELAQRRHRAGEGGLAVAGALATVMDVVLQRVFAYALENYERSFGPAPAPVTLVALGGYGRAELCPRSDVDVMFLLPSRVRDPRVEQLQQALSEEVLYILWDAGLKVGHSTRPLDAVLVEARRDMQTKTSLLDARRLAGSAPLFETFLQSYRSYYLNEDVKAYIDARLRDQSERRRKHGGTVFLQEPEIKNGVGGLRDFQNILWMARVKLGIASLHELADLRYLTDKERRDLLAGYDFLLRVRHDLHFHGRHATDLLSLDVQGPVAARLGYREREELRRVETFMRDYYRHAQAIHRLSHVLENRLALTPGMEEGGRLSFRDVVLARRHQRATRIDGFVLRGRELAYENRSVFIDDPRRLIRVFRHLQQLDATPDFELGNLIRESLPLLTNRVRAAADANLSFRTLLEATGQVYPALSLMHEFGVLGKFIPEFGRLTCLVQHEFYHRYTADIHTLSTIEQLDLVFAGTEDMAQPYAAELRETSNPGLLYVVLLLHDIGKAVSIARHADIGTGLAAPILRRLQYDPQSIESALFLIKNHLIMARFWQKYDVDDPQSATAFAGLVGDLERLRLLYVHTFCDARGTASSLWNNYKDTLHTSLFRATRERLSAPGAPAPSEADRKTMLREHFQGRDVPGISEDEIAAHFTHLPERYFIHTTPDDVVLHLRMVHQLISAIAATDSMGSLVPVVDWQDDLNRSVTTVHVVTWDRAGLFYRLAGAFSVAGVNILSARIHTRADHIAIDSFHVVDPSGGLVQNPKARSLFQSTLESALLHNKDLLPDILAQSRRLRSVLYTPERNRAHAFTPHVDVYNEISLQRTIIEIHAPDQIGLLYRLSRAVYEHGFDITFARVATERGLAVDTFYIEPVPGQAPRSTADLLALRDSIAEIIAPPEGQRALA